MCANVCVANECEDFSIFNETFDNLPFTIRTDEELSIRRENEDSTMTNVKEENLSRWNSLTAVIERYSLFLGNAVENDEEKLRSKFDLTGEIMTIRTFIVFFFFSFRVFLFSNTILTDSFHLVILQQIFHSISCCASIVIEEHLFDFISFVLIISFDK